MQAILHADLHATPMQALFQKGSHVCSVCCTQRLCNPHASPLSEEVVCNPMQALFTWVCMQVPGAAHNSYENPLSQGFAYKPLGLHESPRDPVQAPFRSGCKQTSCKFFRRVFMQLPCKPSFTLVSMEPHATLNKPLFRGGYIEPKCKLLSRGLHAPPGG